MSHSWDCDPYRARREGERDGRNDGPACGYRVNEAYHQLHEVMHESGFDDLPDGPFGAYQRSLLIHDGLQVGRK